MLSFRSFILCQLFAVFRSLGAVEFPDKPLQLVAPDPSHKSLVLIDDNVKLLHGIEGPVATVAVVGKFHSGKSFLMNQLMGKSGGFGVGPSVRPKTMGIWMWGRPVRMTLTSGRKASVIFLDTEGFAANNISENYDAKIFAVATLISSHLLYNSVKIIDQADIDYLELLARRTQLFALRSQMSRAKWTEDFNQELLTFPPLIWVVQDFVQSTEENESPQQWLHRLMGTHTRENEDYDISLLSIFNSVDCHTLFLPAVKKQLLMDLSMAKENDLTEEYREEREELVAKLRKNIVPKEKNHRPLSGRELAGLLEILVTAANEGSLADIPSRWNVFVERLKKSAVEDCLSFYETEMKVLDLRNNGGPIRLADLEDWHKQSSKKALELLLHLLQGLEEAVNESSSKLSQQIALFHERSKDINIKKIRLRCSELHNKFQLKAEELLSSISLPVPSSEMTKQSGQVAQTVRDLFLEELDHLVGLEHQDKLLQALNNNVKTIGQAYEMHNLKAIEGVLQAAVQEASSKFREVTRNEEGGARKPQILKMVYAQGLREAQQVFSEHSLPYKNENVHQAFRALFQAEVKKMIEEMDSENQVMFNTLAQKMVVKLMDEFTTRTDSKHLPLPQNKTDLDRRLLLEGQNILRDYSDGLVDFSVYTTYKDNLDELQRAIDKKNTLRRQENVEALTRVVEMPLKMAREIILLSSDNFKSEFSLRQYMERVCQLQLNQGQAKHWSRELKVSIVDHFISSEDKLQSALRSKWGYWSSFVGYVQWLLWLFYLY